MKYLTEDEWKLLLESASLGTELIRDLELKDKIRGLIKECETQV